MCTPMPPSPEMPSGFFAAPKQAWFSEPVGEVGHPELPTVSVLPDLKRGRSFRWKLRERYKLPAGIANMVSTGHDQDVALPLRASANHELRDAARACLVGNG